MAGYVGRGQPVAVEDNSVETSDIQDGAVTAAKLAPGAAVPSQSTHNGKFLTTDGDDASWATVDLSTKVDKVTGKVLSANDFTNTLKTKLDNAASTTYVDAEVSGLVDSAPATLNTLNELALALGDDANHVTTMTNLIGTKLPLTGGTLSGALTVNGSGDFGNGTNYGISVATHNMSTESDIALSANSTINGDTTLSLCASNYARFVIGTTGRLTGTAGGSEKLRIDSTGIDVTGSVTCDGLTSAGHINSGSYEIQTHKVYGGSSTDIIDILAGGAQKGGQIKLNGGDGAAPAPGVIEFRTGLTGANTERMRIDSSGNVGIGETNPGYKLHIAGAPVGNMGGLLNLRNTAATPTNTTFGGVFFNSSPGTDFSIGKANVNSATTLSFRNGNTGASLMDITSAGNVGIGTNNPSAKLHSTGNILVGAGNSKEPVIQSTNSGRVASNPGYSFNGDLDTGMFNPNLDNTIAFATGATERMRIDSSGKVGIGTSSPSAKVHINSTTDNAYALRVQGNTNNALGVWTGIGISGESNNTKAALLFEDNGTSYSRGSLHLAVNNENNQNNATPADARLTIDSAGRVTMPYQPSFHAFRTTGNFTVTSGWLKIPLNSASGTGHNIGNHFNTSTSRFTAPVSGVYNLAASVNYYGVSSGYLMWATLWKNGSSYGGLFGTRYYSGGGGDIDTTVVGDLYLSVGDYIEVYGYTDDPSGGGSGSTAGHWNYFTGHLVG